MGTHVRAGRLRVRDEALSDEVAVRRELRVLISHGCDLRGTSES